MNKTAVVFDTNSYRYLGQGLTLEQTIEKVADIREKEVKKNIQAYGIMVVGMEMLANLCEEEDGFNYRDCLNGVMAMSHHCFDETHNAPRVIPQPYLHLTRSFFGEVPQEIENRVLHMAGVVNDIKLDYKRALKHHHEKGTFQKIKDYIDAEESQFSTQIIDLIEGAKEEIKRKHPKIDKKQLRVKLLDFIENGPFEPFIALAIIYAVAITLQIRLPQDEGFKRAFNMHLEFPLSVGFYRWISYRIVEGNIDMQSKTSREKRWNWLWDYQVTFLISDITLDQREVILVTSDTDIVDILTEHGYHNRVMNITQYLQFLEGA